LERGVFFLIDDAELFLLGLSMTQGRTIPILAV